MTDPSLPAAVLGDDLLCTIRARAADVDTTGAFPHDDLHDLQRAGYLTLTTPGGGDASLATVSALQRQLAGAAPATALGVNMHLVWASVARRFRLAGSDALAEVERRVQDGEVLAFGISETGNEQALFDSLTVAAPRPDGSYAFTGTKVFTSLSPVWTTLGIHGLDTSSDDAPKLVYALIRRTDEVFTHSDWDALGMRGTHSNSTALSEAVAPASDILARLDPGPSTHPLVFGIYAAFEVLIASVYAGISARALDLAVQSVRERASWATDAVAGELRHRVGEMVIQCGGMREQLDGVAVALETATADLSWYPRLAGLKYRVTSAARSVVDDACTVVGGRSYHAANELSRLARDVRAGTFHPPSDIATVQMAATSRLGPATA